MFLLTTHEDGRRAARCSPRCDGACAGSRCIRLATTGGCTCGEPRTACDAGCAVSGRSPSGIVRRRIVAVETAVLSRSMPSRTPEPRGAQVHVRSCPARAAWARRSASDSSGSALRSLRKRPFASRTQPRATPSRMPWTTTSHAATGAAARASSRSMRGPATAAFAGVSVTCWPTIGFQVRVEREHERLHVACLLRGETEHRGAQEARDGVDAAVVQEAEAATCSPIKAPSAARIVGIGGMPNIPTFW